jgi:hypothetical protein
MTSQIVEPIAPAVSTASEPKPTENGVHVPETKPIETVAPEPQLQPEAATSSAAAPAQTEQTEEEKKIEAANREKKKAFETAALRFVVNNATYDACTRAEDLLRNSESLRVIVNTHFQMERIKLASINAKKKRNEKPETSFSEPCIMFTALNAAGMWGKTKKLSLAAGGNDLDLVDKDSLQSAQKMAHLGVMGFVLIVDALERTTKKYIARVTLLVKVEYRDAPDVFNIADFKARINALTAITRLQIYGSQITIEDVFYKMMLVNIIESTDADKSERTVDATMKSGNADNPEILLTKKEKLLSEADLNGTLDDLRKEANAFQIHELAKNSQDLLIIALTDYPVILERIEMAVAKGLEHPMLVSMTTRASRVDTSDYPVSYCTTKDIHNMIKEKEANLMPVPERLKNILAQAEDPKHKSIGANAVVLEVIDIGTGLMVGLEAYNVCFVPDVLSLKPKIQSQRLLLEKLKTDRTARQREVDAPPPRHFESDVKKTVDDTIKRVIETRDERKKVSRAEWDAYKEKVRKEFEDKLTELENKMIAEQAAAANSAGAVTSTSATSSESTTSAAPSAPIKKEEVEIVENKIT